ncbi:csp [Symbiodinium sp. CCMP2456]|nr:csp [Symbiodinium sp. CCMP2456]
MGIILAFLHCRRLAALRPGGSGCHGQAMAHTGILKRLFSDKGYCFVHSESDERDVFVHFSGLRWLCREDMTDGAEVAFDIGEDPRSGRTKAINLRKRWAWGSALGTGEQSSDWVPGHITEPRRASASAWERTPADGSTHEWNRGCLSRAVQLMRTRPFVGKSLTLTLRTRVPCLGRRHKSRRRGQERYLLAWSPVDRGFGFGEEAGRLRVQDASQELFRANLAELHGTSLHKARRHVFHQLAPRTQGTGVPFFCRLRRTSAQLSNVVLMPLAIRLVPAISLKEALADRHTVVRMDVEYVEVSELQLLSRLRNRKNTRSSFLSIRPACWLSREFYAPASWHLEAETSRSKKSGHGKNLAANLDFSVKTLRRQGGWGTSWTWWCRYACSSTVGGLLFDVGGWRGLSMYHVAMQVVQILLLVTTLRDELRELCFGKRAEDVASEVVDATADAKERCMRCLR